MSNTTTHRKGGSKGANGYGEYTVRNASPKQIAFIERLLGSKEHNYNDLNLQDLNVQGAGEIIDKLLACPEKAGVVIPPTERQVSYVKSLVTHKEGGIDLLNGVLQLRNVHEVEALSKADVSSLINGLRSAPDLSVSIKVNDVGAYLLNETVYSIRKGRYSEEWQAWSYSTEEKKWVRLRKLAEYNVLTTIEPTNRLTLSQAIMYSAQTGMCCHCGRTLTVLKSIADGMGPICITKYK